MNIETMKAGIQGSEQYRISARREVQDAEKLRKAQEQQAAEQILQEVDQYDKENPVGEDVEGIYSISRNDDGSIRVDYVQPGTNAEASPKTESVTARLEAAKSDKKDDDTEAKSGANLSGKTEGAKSGGASAPATTSTDSSSDDDDEELEKLKRQKSEIQQKLNRETDEGVKAQLRVQLQSIEMQIAMKSSGIEA